MSRIIGIFLCVLIIFSAISVSFAAEIGNTSYGYVTKEFYGNQSSDDTIVHYNWRASPGKWNTHRHLECH